MAGCTTPTQTTTAVTSSATTAPPTATAGLPVPGQAGSMTVEQALAGRRSRRSYADAPISVWELGQLLWAAQGVTSLLGQRTAPSAGGLYPLEVYAVTGEGGVDGLSAGVHHYVVGPHLLEPVAGGDLREQLCRAAVSQRHVAEAPVDLVITGVYSRTTGKYGERGVRYVHMEAGHAAQNVYLQAEALDLATVVIGAFDDDWVRRLLGAGEDETPLYVMPVGERA